MHQTNAVHRSKGFGKIAASQSFKIVQILDYNHKIPSICLKLCTKTVNQESCHCI